MVAQVFCVHVFLMTELMNGKHAWLMILDFLFTLFKGALTRFVLLSTCREKNPDVRYPYKKNTRV